LKFIAANPGHPRLAEANLDIARVLNLQGKTELSRALLAEDAKSKRELSAQARATLEQAARQLQAAEKALEAQAAMSDEIKQTQVERALNLYDQASTYIGGGDEQASKLLVEAGKLLSKLADGDRKHPLTWKALAWFGRVQHQTESADKARAKFQEVINAGTPAAIEGTRLARYFRMLVLREQPSDADKKAGVNLLLLDAAARWRNDYRRFHKTPEGVGVAFLFAQTKLAEAATNKKLDGITADRLRVEARDLLREIESSENEFTDRARRLKIQTMAAQGLFKVPVANLRLFEDCYVRAQYEAMEMANEQKDVKNPAEAEAKRKQRLDNITQALQRGLAMPEVKRMKASLEVNNARSMLAYWALNTGKLKEAIAAGETFARDDPRSSQAEMSAVYALQAYSQLVGQKQAKFDESAGDDRTAMFSLASYMEERWPRGIGGDLARHTVGLQLLREENYPEAVKKLSLIGPGYGSYTLVCFQLADACGKAEKASVEPIAGDRPGDYRKRAMIALASMPDSALGPDPLTNQVLVAGKAMLGRDLYRYKRFQQMDDLASGLLAKINDVSFNDDEDKGRAIRNQLRFELVDVKLFARYGLADAAFQAGDHAKVVSLIDPLIDAVNKAGDSQEKTNLQKNQQLGTALLILGLRSNIQLGKVDRTDAVLDVLDKVSGEGGDTTGVFKLMAFLIRGQIDELRKKGDKDALDKAVKGYTAILDKRVKKQKSTTPDFLRVLADCYSNMEEHEKAAAELEKVEAPKSAKPGSPEEALYRRVQTELIRELRLTLTPGNLQKARQLMDGIMGTAKQPGWGRRDLLALKEQGGLLEAEEKFNEAFAVWSDLTKRLAREAPKGGAVREHFFESNFHLVYCIVKIGLAKPAAAERDKYLKLAAQRTAEFEKSWEDFGSEASKRRFVELMAQEPGFKQEYEALKTK
jgi:tetratricopeptide (TPR) repeat protein